MEPTNLFPLPTISPFPCLQSISWPSPRPTPYYLFSELMFSQVTRRVPSSDGFCFLPSKNTWGTGAQKASFNEKRKIPEQAQISTLMNCFAAYRSNVIEALFIINWTDLQVFRGSVFVLINPSFGQWGAGCMNILHLFSYFILHNTLPRDNIHYLTVELVLLSLHLDGKIKKEFKWHECQHPSCRLQFLATPWK